MTKKRTPWNVQVEIFCSYELAGNGTVAYDQALLLGIHAKRKAVKHEFLDFE